MNYTPEIVSYVDKYLSAISEFEESYGCSGFCETGQFWLTKSVSLGAPASACYEITETQENRESENYFVNM